MGRPRRRRRRQRSSQTPKPRQDPTGHPPTDRPAGADAEDAAAAEEMPASEDGTAKPAARRRRRGGRGRGRSKTAQAAADAEPEAGAAGPETADAGVADDTGTTTD